jgi:hypothetical protein
VRRTALGRGFLFFLKIHITGEGDVCQWPRLRLVMELLEQELRRQQTPGASKPIPTRRFIMKIAALYARVSTTNQQQNETIASQLDALMPMLVPMTMRSVPITSTKTRALVAPLSIDRLSTPCVTPWQPGNLRPS